MALPMNDDFANGELSIDELDAIAGGGWFSRAVHWVGHEVKSIVTNRVVVGIAAGVVIVGAIATGGGSASN
ncbi:hypothetical protein [Bradyrhizobium sp. JYMT SZCCT0428]|uniref:hypothetical protein n=1 Tax=Bradyrhizobium sp. JYMT SZCCT0428 TaxID=2807673 RepID=UPI001BA7AD11|nr:hypothetical protein [Bradyrhizobium sp. JYMT SZCCT0428]MBR1157033.1 hypothetical protein [Bradyrhizobium sp. JYMT SZCCT0428]